MLHVLLQHCLWLRYYQYSGLLVASTLVALSSLMVLWQVMGGGTAHGRVSGAVGVPVLEHPGDCYVWGSCGDGPQDGGPWQHSALPSLMKDTTFLDVQKVLFFSLRQAVRFDISHCHTCR